MKKWFFAVFLLCAGCQSKCLHVTKIGLSEKSLASSFPKTPDFRQEHPAKGEQLYIQWKFPPLVELEEGMHLVLNVIYQDLSFEKIIYPLDDSVGALSHFLLNEQFLEKKGFLTYKLELVTSQSETIDTYTHRMWFTIIDVNND